MTIVNFKRYFEANGSCSQEEEKLTNPRQQNYGKTGILLGEIWKKVLSRNYNVALSIITYVSER